MIKYILFAIAVFAVFAVTTSTASTLENNLVGYYTLDETSGNAIDCSEHQDGTITGALQNQVGKINTAYFFNSSHGTDKIDLGDTLDFSGSFTVCAWAYPVGASNSGYLVGKINGSVGFWFRREASYTQWSAGTVAGTAIYGWTVNLNAWQHLCAVIVPGGTSIFYENGTFQSNSTAIAAMAGSNLSMDIGNRADNARAFNGYIDEVGFWDRALTAAEVSELYNSYTGTSCPIEEEAPTCTITQAGNTKFVPNGCTYFTETTNFIEST